MRVTNDARGDLQQLKIFIGERDAVAAEQVIDQFAGLMLLSMLPRLGHPGEVVGTYQKVVPHLPYIITYRIDALIAS